MKKMPFKKRATLVFSLALAFVGAAQAEWLKSYDSSPYDVGFSYLSSQGGIYQSIPGNKQNKFSSLSLLDEQGVPLWRRKIYTGGIDVLGTNELSNGQLLVSGYTQTTVTAPTKAVWAKFKVNRVTGKLSPLFSMTYQGKVNFFHAFPDQKSKKIFGVGEIRNSANSIDMLVSQIDLTTGNPVWTRVLHNGPFDLVNYVYPILGTNRTLLMGQTSTQSDSSDQKILIGLLNNSGKPIAGTFKTYGLDGASNYGTLLPISGGNFLLVGTSTISSTSSFGFPQLNSTAFVIKLNSNLNIVWKKTFKAPKNSNLNGLSAIENSNGSLLINAGYTPAFSFTDPFASFKQHPVTLSLSATGNLLNSKRYEFGDSDSGLFIASPGGGYVYQGTTSSLNQEGSPVGGNTVYGKYTTKLQPVWHRTLTEASLIGSIITPYNNGFLLSGISNLIANQNADLLLGQLNETGDIPGCPEIEPITPKIVNAGITSTNLSWTPVATSVKLKSTSSLVVQPLQLSDGKAPLPTVNTICN